MNTIDILCNYFRITPGELFEEVKPVKEVYPIKKQPFKTTTIYKNIQLKNNIFRRKLQVTSEEIAVFDKLNSLLNEQEKKYS